MEAWRAYQRRRPWVMVMLIGMLVVVTCDTEVESLLHGGGVGNEVGLDTVEFITEADNKDGNDDKTDKTEGKGGSTAEEGAKTADKLNEAEKAANAAAKKSTEADNKDGNDSPAPYQPAVTSYDYEKQQLEKKKKSTEADNKDGNDFPAPYQPAVGSYDHEKQELEKKLAQCNQGLNNTNSSSAPSGTPVLTPPAGFWGSALVEHGRTCYAMSQAEFDLQTRREIQKLIVDDASADSASELHTKAHEVTRQIARDELTTLEQRIATVRASSCSVCSCPKFHEKIPSTWFCNIFDGVNATRPCGVALSVQAALALKMYSLSERYLASFGWSQPYVVQSSGGYSTDYRQHFMRMAEVGVFHKTINECGNSQDVTWALRAPVEGMPTNSSCTDLRTGLPSHTCQTIFTTCFTKTFAIKHLRGETKVTAKYMKAAACTPSFSEGKKSSLCTVKKIVYDCQQCETHRRNTGNLGVENLLRMLSIYDTFKATPPEASTLANANCIADTQLPADLKAGTCSSSNLVTAAMKG